MSFNYQKRSTDELEQIAGIVLSRYAKRCSGCFVDIEGIVEDCELTILLRRGGLNNFCEGYVAENPHYIIIPEAYASYQPRYRAILAEEFSHIVLEFNFLGNGGGLPADAKPHVLTPQQHKDIEDDADYLYRAILFPKVKFIERFNEHFNNAPDQIKSARDKHLVYCARKLVDDFQIGLLAVAYRARNLKLISDSECHDYFSNRIPI